MEIAVVHLRKRERGGGQAGKERAAACGLLLLASWQVARSPTTLFVAWQLAVQPGGQWIMHYFF
jgi:hypothetical protein